MDVMSTDYGIFLLRLALAALFAAHALLKLRVFTIAGTMAFFRSIGLPSWLAPVTIAMELAGAAALFLGIAPRIAALLLVPLILGTILTVHGKNGWLFTNQNGGWEFPAFWAATLFALALLGDGAFVLVPSSIILPH
ncbi:DoxX family protein [Mesorhizobium sp. CU2]|uniref:DoxX family protein n=1 Tax=unclassified Mesorhizobium TaxID=325217 RepID=UPI00112BD5E4|nr:MULTISPECIES: DoxX family protein [unclassified Mesorhizobium]TPN81165.1 DoxX family protein [Mesorhizobium sp. CU3]TPO11708.1 DoxX family protein [Mesorhizobium sp. CU2]